MPRKLSSLTDLEGPHMDALSYDTGAMSDLGADPETSPGVESSSKEEAVTEVGDTEDRKSAEEVMGDYTLTAKEEWLNELKDMDVSVEEAENIIDKVMSTGKYEESYRMGATKFKFRTRTTVDADRTIEILQESKPESTGVYAHLISRVNLAASLVSYGKSKFPHTDPSPDNRAQLDNEWRARYRFCASLPAPAFYTLSQVLQKFDLKVNLACDARGLENF